MKNLASKLQNIKLVIFDVDGVLTDNTVYIGSDGNEFKRFNIADGLGTYIAKRHGIDVAFLSGRQSKATETRSKELNIEDVFQKPVDKLVFYDHLKSKYDLADKNIAFVGNDLVDVGVMKRCGLAIAVPDSPPLVLKIADYVTKKHGGFGAARELLDMVLDAKGISEEERLA